MHHFLIIRWNDLAIRTAFSELIDKAGPVECHAGTTSIRGKTMTVKIYGPSMSRASRVTWCAKGLASPSRTSTSLGPAERAAYLAINPNGKFPGFADGDLKLFESLAINLYLAKKYGTGELYPTNAEDEARVLQWTLWAAAEVEHLVITSALVKLGISKDVATAEAGLERVKPAMKVLDGHLQGRNWMVGDKFSVADINVASVIATGRFGGLDLSGLPNVSRWLEACVSRPKRK
jgi:glutathione S-transferase